MYSIDVDYQNEIVIFRSGLGLDRVIDEDLYLCKIQTLRSGEFNFSCWSMERPQGNEEDFIGSFVAETLELALHKSKLLLIKSGLDPDCIMSLEVPENYKVGRYAE